MRTRSILPIILTACAAVLVRAVPVYAAGLDLGIFEISDIVNLPEGDPREIAVKLVNVALEFVGILMLVMVLWGGVLFLFSGGKKENMDRAGRVIKNAIIGLIIIFCSWAIVKFVITQFVSATNGNEANVTDVAPPPPDVPL